MIQAAALVQALETPAALVDADGTVVAANTAFEASGAAMTAGRLAQGACHETLGASGELIAWKVLPTEGGALLLLGQAVTPAPDARAHHLAALSHELRTPLNGVLGMAALLSDTKLTAEQKAYLGSLRDCGEHLLGLVNDVLDLARLDAGKVTLHPAPTEVRRLLQTVVESLSPKAHAKGLEIAWTAPAEVPVILADEGRLRQILFNLAGNAVKFTETGGVLLSVEQALGAASEGAVTLRFVVTDTGPGVPAAQHERIFEAFAQADPNHAKRADSTGLGLAIVRRLTAAHGGAAGLDSPEGGGASFWFEARFAVHAPGEMERPLACRQVAVISPNLIVRAAARGQIEAAGGEAVTVASVAGLGGRLAPGAVVLVDHALANGRRRPRPIEGHPSVILVPPEARAEIVRYRAAGFSGYLIKPLRAASLVERALKVSGDMDEQGVASDERATPSLAVGARVLLAEDNPINALLARSLLEREGCCVERVASGLDAVAAGASGAFDLILMDLRMPGLDGREATRALRGRGCRTPIIALTADAFEEDRRACLAAGMDDFLTKPLQQSVLHVMLRRWTRPGWTREAARAKVAG